MPKCAFRVVLARFSVEHAALIGGHHIFDVDESIFSAVLLEQFESVLDEVSENEGLALAVLDLVAQVHVAVFEQVEDRQDLSIVGHEGLTDGVGAEHQLLQDLQSNGDDLLVAGVQSGYIKFELNWQL